MLFSLVASVYKLLEAQRVHLRLLNAQTREGVSLPYHFKSFVVVISCEDFRSEVGVFGHTITRMWLIRFKNLVGRLTSNGLTCCAFGVIW